MTLCNIITRYLVAGTWHKIARINVEVRAKEQEVPHFSFPKKKTSSCIFFPVLFKHECVV